jgi:hypothetical protein
MCTLPVCVVSGINIAEVVAEFVVRGGDQPSDGDINKSLLRMREDVKTMIEVS